MSETWKFKSKDNAGGFSVRQATVAELIDLRHRILRAGLPRDTAIFPGDDHADALHIVATNADGSIVGCATFHLNEWEGRPAYQLRGMAIDDTIQRGGVGRSILAFAEDLIRRQTPVRQLWCNARVPAVGFYERLGWRVVSEPFDVPTAGPHVKMTKSLYPSA